MMVYKLIALLFLVTLLNKEIFTKKIIYLIKILLNMNILRLHVILCQLDYYYCK